MKRQRLAYADQVRKTKLRRAEMAFVESARKPSPIFAMIEYGHVSIDGLLQQTLREVGQWPAYRNQPIVLSPAGYRKWRELVIDDICEGWSNGCDSMFTREILLATADWLCGGPGE